MHTHTPWIVRQRDGWSFHGIQNSAAIAQNPYFFDHSKTQNLVDLQIVFRTHRRVPHSLRYKTRSVCSHSSQWILQKSVSEDLFQSTAKEEFHILSYKTQWVSCFFPFNNLMNLIELWENCISVTIPFPSLCLLLRFAGLCFFLFLLFTCFQFTVLAAATDTKADANDRWS
jgi:hypothetical protein